ILQESGLEPERLILELTESGLMQDTSATHDMLQELKSLGVRIAIDDFGIGYSSLSYLRRFPIDILKIDRTFVDAIGDSPEDSTLARAIVTLGSSLGLDVVAEGVERADQMAWLRDLGCEMGQGFFFSRPMAAEGMSSFVESVAVAPVDNVVRFPRVAG
ncbi:MAG: EAL domain-containing protein, partial [Actinomycetota bacterium]